MGRQDQGALAVVSVATMEAMQEGQSECVCFLLVMSPHFVFPVIYALAPHLVTIAGPASLEGLRSCTMSYSPWHRTSSCLQALHKSRLALKSQPVSGVAFSAAESPDITGCAPPLGRTRSARSAWARMGARRMRRACTTARPSRCAASAPRPTSRTATTPVWAARTLTWCA